MNGDSIDFFHKGYCFTSARALQSLATASHCQVIFDIS